MQIHPPQQRGDGDGTDCTTKRTERVERERTRAYSLQPTTANRGQLRDPVQTAGPRSESGVVDGASSI